MADTFDEFDDPYRRRVTDELGPTSGIRAMDPNIGIVGPDEFRSPAPTPAPAKTGGFDLERTRQAWAAPGIGGRASMSDLQKFLADNQEFTQGVTLRGEKLYDPNGRFMFDAIGNYKSGDPNQMTRIALDGIGSNGQPRTARPRGAGASGVGGGVRGPSAMPSPSGMPPAANNFLTQIREQIMARLGKMSGAPSMADPALAAQSEAYRRSRERGADQERAAMAERAAAQGTLIGGQSSGSFDTALGGIREAASEDIAGNDAQLMGAEVSARRAEVQSLLNMALQSGDAESARMLQLQLAKMDEALRKQALSENARQFDASDRYRYSALGEQGRQFDDQFGRDLGRDYENDYRWRALFGLGG